MIAVEIAWGWILAIKTAVVLAIIPFGALLLGAGVLALLFPLVSLEGGSSPVVVILVAAPVLLVAFFRWEARLTARGREPLLDVTLLRRLPGYASGLAIGAIYFTGFTGIFLVLSVHLQEELGFTPLQAGLLMTPEEPSPPPIDAAASAARVVYRHAAINSYDVVRLLRDDRRRRIHFALLDRFDDRRRGHVDPVHALAAAKIAEAHSVEEALSFLDQGEQIAALDMPELYERLAALPVSAPA